jgi:hypothetical protein
MGNGMVLGALDQELLPVLDLIGMNIELFGQFSESAPTLHGSQSELRFQGQ